MWWHKLKFVFCMAFLLAIVGCSTVNIGQVDETISARDTSVSVIETSGRVRTAL